MSEKQMSQIIDKFNIKNLTKTQLLELEKEYTGEPIYSVVIVPTNYLHDSGFQCMKYILLGNNNELIGVVGGGSDVVHINGIGGMGINFDFKPKMPIGWKIDCLPKSKCVRLFCDKELFITESFIGSDFSIYSKKGD